MREDIAKVLVERARKGGVGNRESRRNRHETRQACKDVAFNDEIETDNFRGMKRVHTAKKNSYDNLKELNENLKPLRRFLKSKIGCKWDDVYKEIMSGLNLNNAVQYHVWQHLIGFGEVETKTYMENGIVMASGVLGPRSMTDSPYGGDEFYVDPRDGTLRCTKKISSPRNRNKNRTDSYRDPKNPMLQYHKVDGVWYEFKFRKATAEEKSHKSFGHYGPQSYNEKTKKWENSWVYKNQDKFVDQIAGEVQRGYYIYFHERLWNLTRNLFGDYILPIEKRQISSREIRRIEELIAKRKPSRSVA